MTISSTTSNCRNRACANINFSYSISISFSNINISTCISWHSKRFFKSRRKKRSVLESIAITCVSTYFTRWSYFSNFMIVSICNIKHVRSINHYSPWASKFCFISSSISFTPISCSGKSCAWCVSRTCVKWYFFNFSIIRNK